MRAAALSRALVTDPVLPGLSACSCSSETLRQRSHATSTTATVDVSVHYRTPPLLTISAITLPLYTCGEWSLHAEEFRA